ncbi:hypothetical protein MRX96_008131 [Rhipicephalus microplus]
MFAMQPNRIIPGTPMMMTLLSPSDGFLHHTQVTGTVAESCCSSELYPVTPGGITRCAAGIPTVTDINSGGYTGESAAGDDLGARLLCVNTAG